MSVIIKTSEMQYKDNNGVYHGVNAIAEKKTADMVAEIDTAISAQENRIATDISSMQSAADGIEAQKNTMIASIASVAGQGTDTTLTQSGVAADAKVAGDKISGLKSAFSEIAIIEKFTTTDSGTVIVPIKTVIGHTYRFSVSGAGGVNIKTSGGDTVVSSISAGHTYDWVATLDSDYFRMWASQAGVTVVCSDLDSEYFTVDEEVREHSDFISDNFDNIEQYLDITKKTSGKFYYANTTNDGSASGYCIFPPVNVTANKTYTLINVRPLYCNIKVGATITTLDADDNGTQNKTFTFIPQSDGQLYITGGDSAIVMLFDADYRQSEYIYGKFNYKIKNETIGKQIGEENCTFFKECYQYLKSAEVMSGYWNITSQNKIDWSSNDRMKRYPAIKLEKGVSYKFFKVYGYFCIIADGSGNAIERITSDTTSGYIGVYTPANDCYAYVSVHTDLFETAMLCNDTEYIPDEYTEGKYYTYWDAQTKIEKIDIHVKTDGTGDYTSVVDAVQFANGRSGSYPINIYIHTGDYNILTELGGQTFIDTIESSLNERQGLVLLRDNVNLIGVGYVILRFEMPNTVTETQSERVSCLNLREFSNKIENLTLIAKNCRYTIHDETNGGNPYIHRVMKNLRCIHKGNAEGLWRWCTVMGGGAGGGSIYDIINCQFITSVYHQAFSYHTNYNQEPSFFNIDGCVGSVKSDASSKISFKFSYHGTGRTGICIANVKNCSGNGNVIVVAESSGDTNNNIELYNNGWENIEPIPVTGNE